MAGAFHCSVVTPEKMLTEADATYASIPAWDGQMGIAVNRAPLLVKLGTGPLRLELAGGGEYQVIIEGGFAQMTENRLTVLANRAITTDQIDPASARKDLEAALAMKPRSDEEFAARENLAASARTRLRMGGPTTGATRTG